jgi:hypothetical protein
MSDKNKGQTKKGTGLKKSYGEAVARPVIKPPKINPGKSKDK